MKIGILLHPYGERSPGGLGRIIFELTLELMRRYPDEEYLVYFKGVPSVLPSFPAKKVQVHFLPDGFLWLDRGFAFAPKADVYLFNTPVLPFIFTPRRAVVLSLDYAYWQMPSRGVRARAARAALFFVHWLSLRKAKAVVAISEATRRDTVALFGLSGRKVRTIYFGFKQICELPGKPLPVPADYVLFPGAWKERKNVHGVVEAFKIYRERGGKLHLVLSGADRGPYADRVWRLVVEAGLLPYVHRLGHVSDEELAYLYKHSRAVLFPSFIEGFGYPVLEAMDCGVPVITSNRSSLPELAGSAGIVIDPNDPGAIAEALARVLVPSVRNDMRFRGKEQAARFSWENGIRELYELFFSLR